MLRLTLPIVALCLCLAAPAWSQEKGDYAAVAANAEGSLLVRWGKTKEEARQRASRACENSSRTCTSDPASTNDLDDVFAYLCCTKPRFSCVSPPHENRAAAEKAARELAAKLKMSDCKVRAYFSARNGKKL
jgi:hypothetical protein